MHRIEYISIVVINTRCIEQKIKCMAPFGKNRTSLQLYSSHFLTLFLLRPPGVLVPVLPGSKNFDNSIRPPLQNSYMYKESKQSFRYNSAFLINNATLQERVSISLRYMVNLANPGLLLGLRYPGPDCPQSPVYSICAILSAGQYMYYFMIISV